MAVTMAVVGPAVVSRRRRETGSRRPIRLVSALSAGRPWPVSRPRKPMGHFTGNKLKPLIFLKTYQPMASGTRHSESKTRANGASWPACVMSYVNNDINNKTPRPSPRAEAVGRPRRERRPRARLRSRSFNKTSVVHFKKCILLTCCARQTRYAFRGHDRRSRPGRAERGACRPPWARSRPRPRSRRPPRRVRPYTPVAFDRQTDQFWRLGILRRQHGGFRSYTIVLIPTMLWEKYVANTDSLGLS